MFAKFAPISLVVLLAVALAMSLPQKAGAQQRDYEYREWYLSNLWELHNANSVNLFVNAIFGLTDTYIKTFIAPNTGETAEQVRTRLGTVFGGNPTTAQLFTAAVLESYNAADCSNYTQSQCYMLEITHWAITQQVLVTLLGSTVTFDSVKADDYAPDWAGWTIPKPPARPTAQPSLELRYDPAGLDRNCPDFATWQEAQAFFWATENDSHGLDPDGDGIVCESLPGAPQIEAVIITPTPPDNDVVRFYDVNDPDEYQEWTRQGGVVAIEVKDRDLDVVTKLAGDSAESITLTGTQSFFLSNVPLADRNGDGFVNAGDVTVVDASNNTVAVSDARDDGRIVLQTAHTGDVRVSYWGNSTDDTGDTVRVKSQADPSGITVVLEETKATSGVFRGMVATNGANAGDASDADTSPYPTLKVGKNDVIRVTYNDADPRRTVSATLRIVTPPTTSSGYTATTMSDPP